MFYLIQHCAPLIPPKRRQLFLNLKCSKPQHNRMRSLTCAIRAGSSFDFLRSENSSKPERPNIVYARLPKIQLPLVETKSWALNGKSTATATKGRRTRAEHINAQNAALSNAGARARSPSSKRFSGVPNPTVQRDSLVRWSFRMEKFHPFPSQYTTSS